jgi:hypothetical protein
LRAPQVESKGKARMRIGAYVLLGSAGASLGGATYYFTRYSYYLNANHKYTDRYNRDHDVAEKNKARDAQTDGTQAAWIAGGLAGLGGVAIVVGTVLYVLEERPIATGDANDEKPVVTFGISPCTDGAAAFAGVRF